MTWDNLTLTILLSLDILYLESMPQKVRELVCEHGTQEDLCNRSSETFVETNLARVSKGEVYLTTRRRNLHAAILPWYLY